MILWIAFGSALGGVARYLLGGAVQLRRTTGDFPIGTLTVNVLGALILGFVMRLALEIPGFNPQARAFLTIGFCGGFTTFSTFSYESAVMLQRGDWGRLAVYAGLSVALTVAAVLAGAAGAGQWLAFRRTI